MIDFLFILTGFLVAGFIASFIINNVLLRFSRSLGIRNKNDVTVRWSNESKPSLGGISMYAVFLFAVMALAACFPYLRMFENNSFLSLLAGGTVAFVVGITDDAYNTKPLLKLGGQILCGLLVIYSGHHIILFDVLLVDNVITVLWIVVIMNSLNMLDNMDGITGTVSVAILLTCGVALILVNGPFINYNFVLIAAVVGALIGFLVFNIHPSKMFMGDTGSQFISFFLAYFSIESLWNAPYILEAPSWVAIILVLTVFTPAAVDTLTVVVNRLRKGKSPMVGGKDHTTHHLVYKGISDFGVWVIFLALSVAALLFGIVIINLLKEEMIWLTWIGLFYFIFVFFLLYRNTIKYKNPNE